MGRSFVSTTLVLFFLFVSAANAQTPEEFFLERVTEFKARIIKAINTHEETRLNLVTILKKEMREYENFMRGSHLYAGSPAYDFAPYGSFHSSQVTTSLGHWMAGDQSAQIALATVKREQLPKLKQWLDAIRENLLGRGQVAAAGIVEQMLKLY